MKRLEKMKEINLKKNRQQAKFLVLDKIFYERIMTINKLRQKDKITLQLFLLRSVII